MRFSGSSCSSPSARRLNASPRPCATASPSPPPAGSTAIRHLGALGNHAAGDSPDALDGDLDGVPRHHPHRRLAGEPDAARGPGGDHVAGTKRGERREVLDRSRDVEDHLRGARRLHDLAVQARRQLDVGGVHLVRGDHLRADRHRRVEVLARRPLRRCALPLARRRVVEDDVAGDHREGILAPVRNGRSGR